jgi:hypothetical protein
MIHFALGVKAAVSPFIKWVLETFNLLYQILLKDFLEKILTDASLNLGAGSFFIYG